MSCGIGRADGVLARGGRTAVAQRPGAPGPDAPGPGARAQSVHDEVQEPAGAGLPVAVRDRSARGPRWRAGSRRGSRPGGWCRPPRWRASRSSAAVDHRAVARLRPGCRACWWPGASRRPGRPWPWRTGRGGPSTRAGPGRVRGSRSSWPRRRRPAAPRSGRPPGRAPRGWGSCGRTCPGRRPPSSRSRSAGRPRERVSSARATSRMRSRLRCASERRGASFFVRALVLLTESRPDADLAKRTTVRYVLQLSGQLSA